MKIIQFSELIILSAILATGCAVQNDKTKVRGMGLTYNAEITTDQHGNYISAVEAAPLAGRKGGAESYAMENATKYCNNENKTVKIIKNQTKSHLLVNGVAKLTFTCI
ncbi:hypothetical protein ABFY41_14230 [Acinetobacter haemolyticus]|uniref:hypothetical protein n=1 Tax=Acinetobacter haemolyticus TaxID=29430 RepID=UPI002A6A59BC|nr:hypothetical protein [Acinetobacter haemolyticus]WPO68667.1 hypothetical protein SDC64_07010 [Acinetobacter haemolyticus]